MKSFFCTESSARFFLFIPTLWVTFQLWPTFELSDESEYFIFNFFNPPTESNKFSLRIHIRQLKSFVNFYETLPQNCFEMETESAIEFYVGKTRRRWAFSGELWSVRKQVSQLNSLPIQTFKRIVALAASTHLKCNAFLAIFSLPSIFEDYPSSVRTNCFKPSSAIWLRHFFSLHELSFHWTLFVCE